MIPNVQFDKIDLRKNPCKSPENSHTNENGPLKGLKTAPIKKAPVVSRAARADGFLKVFSTHSFIPAYLNELAV